MGIGEKMVDIQSKLNAPKNLFNKFGNYSYRSAESILEAVKPLLRDNKCYLVLTDDICEVGNRVYVKATATIYDAETNDSVTNTAFAREADNKKGQDDSQITGATSSYARKYALNGLFLIDDNKDADTDEYHNQTHQRKQTKQDNIDSYQKVQEEKPNRVQLDSLYGLAKQKGFTQEQVWKAGRVKSEDQMTMRHYMAVFERLQKLPDVRQGNLNL